MERFPFCESDGSKGKAKSEKQERKKSVDRLGIERAKIQKRRHGQHARERKVIFVFGMEIELECRNGERQNEDERVGSLENDVEEDSDDREIRHHGSGVRSNRAEFAQLANPRKSVEYGDRFQKHEGECRTHRIESKDAYEEREHANVRIREKEQVPEAPLSGIRVPSKEHYRTDGGQRHRDVGYEQGFYGTAPEQPVRKFDEMDRGKDERVGTEYLGRHVMLRSKDGEDGEGNDGQSERKPAIKGLERYSDRSSKRIGYSV